MVESSRNKRSIESGFDPLEKSRESARGLGHLQIGPEHLLLAIIAQNSRAAQILETEAGFTYQDLEVDVVTTLGKYARSDSETLQLMPETWAILKQTAEDTGQMVASLDPESVLLALINSPNVGSNIIMRLRGEEALRKIRNALHITSEIPE